ncbi:FecCD family ABC transporter permease [Acetobacterium woodii]|uniref:Putative metal ABC transport system permease protein n=1 Tax=Acetobacterium woodii (strain ATCC 29683 / DSM 1030 / JCM 2381 / KCTC 1655 / WB1) TaxID=931626 RepID=H6LI82_ACEWD|nr:iron chelate uptake ABC transporter family permease subunit [Acetobacterium woodii]AFA49782.1 putative metal ABC transport system permease protein [Acetobacterium woodii DSM 1030]
MRKLKKYALPLSIIICLAIIYLCTLIGIASISFWDANKILLKQIAHINLGMENISDGAIAIIWNVRLPRVILAFLTGGALALCGAAYQGIFKNPMADPYILGVSSGAALGASIGIVMNLSSNFLGRNGIALLAFAGSFLTILLVYNISRVGRKVPVATLLLSGIAIGQSLGAFMSLLMIFNNDSMNQIIFWIMGSLNGKGWDQVLIILPYLLIGCVIMLTSVRELDIMLLGEETATQLGVNTEALKKKILFSSSLITAAVVAVTGIIGFVGLIVPHIVRMVTGPKHRTLVPFSVLFGGAFLILCDTLARSVTSQEIPVGVITAAFGGPFFVYLLRKRKKGGA